MPNKPNGRHSVNVSTDKYSHLLLKCKDNFADVAADPDHPNPGELFKAKVKDIDNANFLFKATVVGQLSKKRLALRLQSKLPAGGADPTEGLLTITLFTAPADPALPPDETEVSDVPVDYISDPNAP